MNDFSVILITGSRKGIGRYLAERYLAEGHKIIGCSRSETDLSHENYRHFCLDIAKEKEVVAMIKEVVKVYGRIDVAINNAGIASMNALMLTTQATVRSVLETNLIGSFTVMREAAKSMIRKKKGKIINFTTVAVALDLEGEAIYAASKSALESLTRISAKELGPYGITVNAVGPTPIETDLIKTVPKKKIEELIERQSVKRLGQFKDVKNVIDFYMNNDSDFVTGQTLYLGGVFA